eukprot:712953-Rhodomonas_salina.1
MAWRSSASAMLVLILEVAQLHWQSHASDVLNSGCMLLRLLTSNWSSIVCGEAAWTCSERLRAMGASACSPRKATTSASRRVSGRAEHQSNKPRQLHGFVLRSITAS